MYQKNEIENKNQGWKKVTDMLRASYLCVNAKEVKKAIDKLND